MKHRRIEPIPIRRRIASVQCRIPGGGIAGLVVVATALAILAVSCSADGAGGSGAGASSDSPTVAGSGSSVSTANPAAKEPVVAVVKAALPAVVNVTTDLFQPNPFGGTPRQGRGVGTGFIVRSDGIIVTNCHVVEGASKITVFLNGQNGAQGRHLSARVIGSDCLHDMAVLKVGETGLPTMSLGNSSLLQLGQSVVAIGYALDLTGGPTVTAGIVSSLDRTIQAQDPGCAPQTCRGGVRTYAGVIQTDAAINPGNSGGPLLNLQGQVVGIDSAGSQNAENIGFAIPIDDAKATILSAEQHPLAPAPYLGVITQSVTSDIALRFGLPVDHGAYVVATPPDSPAAKAGIQRGDVIVSLSGTTINSADDVAKALGSLRPGHQVAVRVVTSSGATKTITVTLGTRPLPAQLP
jgi:serine protease Do